LSKLVNYVLRALGITAAVALTAAAAGARAADGDEVMATRSNPAQAPATASTAAPVPAAPVSTEQQINDWIRQAPPVSRMSRDDADPWTDAPVVAEDDGRPHGEVGAMVGSGGMRAVYGTATIPLGDNGRATVSISQGHKLPYYGPYSDPRFAPYPPF
jgi:hypothetical protein